MYSIRYERYIVRPLYCRDKERGLDERSTTSVDDMLGTYTSFWLPKKWRRRGGEEEIYFTIFPQLSYDPMNCFVEWMQHSRASQHWKMIPVLTDNEFIIHYCILVGQHSWRFKYAILRILFDVLA